MQAAFSPGINGFRGLCVALVFLHHVANSGLPPAPDAASFWQNAVQRLFMSFGYGVELFFMISGYVIVNSLRRHATVSGFLADRALRIFPVWWPLAAALCIASIVAGRPGFGAGEPSAAWLVLLGNLLLLPPLLPLPLVHPASWSLTYEWVFYLASAAAAGLWRRPATPWFARAAWGLAVALLIACFPRALFFLPGVLVALAPDIVRPLRRGAWLAAVALPVFLLAWFSTGVFAAQYERPLWTVLQAGRGPAVLLALGAATCLFAWVAAPGERGPGWLGTRAAQHLGTISYSFYLVHPLVMAAVKPLLLRALPDARGNWAATLAFALASALLAWGLSYLSWRVLEQKLARWVQGRQRRPRGAAAPQPASMRAKSGPV